MELPILGVDAAFCGALVRSPMNGPYRQYQQQESLLLTQPHRLLDYLNLQLLESGLRHPLPWRPCCSIRRMGCFLQMPGSLTSLVDACRGLLLGLMRSSRYTLHRRSWHEPLICSFAVTAAAP
jgi:hypothetical protein